MARAAVNLATAKTNILINGGMDFWQRTIASVASTGTPSYQNVDRWQLETGGAGSANITRSTDLPGQQWGSYSIMFTQVGSGATSHRIWQRIEAANIAPYIGQVVTLSYWAKTSVVNVNTASQTIFIVPVTTPDVWPSENTSATEILSLSEASGAFTAGQWKRFSYNLLVPASAVRGLGIGILGIGDTASHTWNFAGITLTPLGAPTQLVRAAPTIGQEFSLCQRYYEKSYDMDIAPGSAGTAGAHSTGILNGVTSANTVGAVIYKVTKRIAVAPTFYSTTGAINSIRYNGADTAVNTGGNFGIASSLIVNNSGGTLAAASVAATYQYAVNAEL